MNQIKDVWEVKIDHLEICVLIPTGRAQVFAVSKPSYSGLFEEYHVFGKAEGVMSAMSSEQEHVKICSVEE